MKQTASNAVARGACELRECDYLCKLDRPRKIGPHRGSRRTPDGPARSGQSALGVPARSHPSGGGGDGQQVVSAARVAGHRSNRSDFAPKQSAAARSAPRHARADNSAALAAAVSAPGAETAAARAGAREQRGQPRARARAWQAATCGTLRRTGVEGQSSGRPLARCGWPIRRPAGRRACRTDVGAAVRAVVATACSVGATWRAAHIASKTRCAEKARFIDSELP